MSKSCGICKNFQEDNAKYIGHCIFYKDSTNYSDGECCVRFEVKAPVAQFGAGCTINGVYRTNRWSDFNRAYENNENGFAELEMISESGETVARLVWRDGKWV